MPSEAIYYDRLRSFERLAMYRLCHVLLLQYDILLGVPIRLTNLLIDTRLIFLRNRVSGGIVSSS